MLRFRVCEFPGRVTFTDTESEAVAARAWRRREQSSFGEQRLPGFVTY